MSINILMHAKTLEALLCLSSPIMMINSSKFPSFQLLSVNTDEVKENQWEKEEEENHFVLKCHCLCYKFTSIKIHEDNWRISDAIHQQTILTPRPKKSLVLFESMKCKTHFYSSFLAAPYLFVLTLLPDFLGNYA